MMKHYGKALTGLNPELFKGGINAYLKKPTSTEQLISHVIVSLMTTFFPLLLQIKFEKQES